MENLVSNTPEQRVRFFIKEVAEEHGRKILMNDEEREVKLKLSHEEIAKLSATSRQTVKTVLNQLGKKGIISYDRRRIFVRKLSAL